MKQTIEFVKITEKRVPFDRQDAFQFRKDRPCQWLQKACFFVLRNLRAYSISEALQIERHVLDPSTFMERLFRQKNELVQRFNIHPELLLIGAKDYADLMCELEATQVLTFHAEYHHRHEVFGLTVRVIPWMRGCLVMPKLPLDTRRAK